MKYRSSLLFLFISLTCVAQKQITVDDFTTKNTFAAKTVTGINWMNDGKFYSTIENNKIIKYNITTGQAVETIIDGSLLNPKIDIQNYAFSNDEKKILLVTNFQSKYRHSYIADYFVYELTSKSLRKLSENGRQSYAAFSPDASKAAFVRENNLFYVNLADMSEVQVTTDGKFNHIINGTTDWVYEEEFSFVVGFFWSPDGKKLAYYRFDESNVKEYNMQVWGRDLYPYDYKFKYPKAGEVNSKVEIFIYDLNSKAKVKADIGNEDDIYIPRVTWANNPNILSIRKMNRLQNMLELIHTDATTGISNVVLTEKSDTFVDLENTEELVYLKGGKQFIKASESSGYKQLYLYNIDGTLVRQIAKGNFEMDFIGFDETTKILYYLSTEPSPLERHFYSIHIDGGKKTKLSQNPGWHTINMSKDFQFYIDYNNSATHPDIISLFKTKGNTLIKTLEKNETLSKRVEEYSLVTKEFFTFQTVDGTSLNGYMLKPQDFDASKKYPVLLYQYSGPGSQNVSNAWGSSHFYFHQLLVQKGYVVVVIDTRGTCARGEAFKKLTYKQLGKFELEDILASARYLASLNYVDNTRMGIWGWSYGGYMTCLAMTKGGGIFKMGIAVAPVTNWRFYDTIYTERYLQTPQLNPRGYDDNSPLTYAGNLQGKFLLIHGTGDDNVHFQNSMLFQDALINVGKQFSSFYYPDRHHGIQGAKAKHHLYTMMMNYVLKTL